MSAIRDTKRITTSEPAPSRAILLGAALLILLGYGLVGAMDERDALRTEVATYQRAEQQLNERIADCLAQEGTAWVHVPTGYHICTHGSQRAQAPLGHPLKPGRM